MKLIIKWYDIWVGLFIDRKQKCVYFFPVPCIGLKIFYHKHVYCYDSKVFCHTCFVCGEKMKK